MESYKLLVQVQTLCQVLMVVLLLCCVKILADIKKK